MEPGIQGADRAIVLIEDDANDAAFTGRAIHKLGISNPLLTFYNAESAIGFLAPEEGVPPAVPGLILIDLNLPGINGFQFLTWLRRKPALRPVPLIIITGSLYSRDIHRAYQLGADSFISKTNDLKQLIRDIKLVTDFWLPRSQRVLSAEASPEPAIQPVDSADESIVLTPRGIAQGHGVDR